MYVSPSCVSTSEPWPARCSGLSGRSRAVSTWVSGCSSYGPRSPATAPSSRRVPRRFRPRPRSGGIPAALVQCGPSVKPIDVPGRSVAARRSAFARRRILLETMPRSGCSPGLWSQSMLSTVLAAVSSWNSEGSKPAAVQVDRVGPVAVDALGGDQSSCGSRAATRSPCRRSTPGRIALRPCSRGERRPSA
jgi:hypothetical protein